MKVNMQSNQRRQRRGVGRGGFGFLFLILVLLVSGCGRADRAGDESRRYDPAPAAESVEESAADEALEAPAQRSGPATGAVEGELDSAESAAPRAVAPSFPRDGSKDRVSDRAFALPDRIASDRAEAERSRASGDRAALPSGEYGQRYRRPERRSYSPPDDMFFHDWGVNPWQDSWQDNRSTFALDVDTGAYTMVRSYLEDGNLPPAEAVRVEEMVNYLDQGYRAPWSGDFAIHVDGAVNALGTQEGEALVRIGIQAREISDRRRKPARLTFVIDVSGSMEEGGRLEMVKDALATLVDGLDGRDAVAIVAYSEQAWEVLPMTPADDRRAILRALGQLRPMNSTNAEAGLDLGYAIAGEAFDPEATNRVVLCSDGVANVGATGPMAILQRVDRELARGVTLTAIGVGMGNYNDALLEQLADHGEGSYHYVDSRAEAERVFSENLTGTLELVARDAKAQVEFNPETVWAYRLIGYENRDVADRDFRNDSVDAGEVGAGHSVTALYALSLVPHARGELATVQLRWADPETARVHEIAQSLSTADLAAGWDRADAHFRLTAALAAFAEILRDSPYTRELPQDYVLRLAEDAADELDTEEAYEVVKLMDRAGWSDRLDGVGGRVDRRSYGYP
jgi:Ca-activated chloride channel family protein